MNRGTIIALAAGAAGVLATSAFAGVAVYNAATVSSRADDAVVMAAAPQPVVEGVSERESAPALPELPQISASPSAAEGTATAPTDQGADEATEPRTTPAITKAKASKVALSEAPGEVLGVNAKSRNGYQAWAVRIKRPDGSIVTGYVDKASGVAFDWVIDQQAPATTYSDDDEGDYEDEGGSDHEEEGSDDD
jgi:hypothetical protein